MRIVWQALGEGLVCARQPIGHLSSKGHYWSQQEPVWAIMLMSHNSFKVAYICSTKFCIIENIKYRQAVCPKDINSSFFGQFSAVDIFHEVKQIWTYVLLMK